MDDTELYNCIASSPAFKAGDMEAKFENFISSRCLSSYDELIDFPQQSFYGKTIVDLPAGSGPIAKKILPKIGPRGKVFAIDFNKSELDKIPKLKQITTYCAKAQSIPLDSNSVDFVFCHLGLMLFKPLDMAIKEIARVLRPGGKLVANLINQTKDPVFNAYLNEALFFERQIENFTGWGENVTAFFNIDMFNHLLKNCGFSSPAQYSTYYVSHKGTIDETIDAANVFFQVHYLMMKPQREEYFAKLKEKLSRYLFEDKISISIPFKKLIVTK